MTELLACPHADHCAGCSAIHQPYDQQLAAKRERVQIALARYPSLASIKLGATLEAAQRSAYRTRSKLVVSGASGQPAVGLFDRDGSHRVVDIPSCPVAAPAVGHIADAIRALLRSPPRELSPWLRPFDAGGILRAVDLRETIDPDATPRVLVTLVLDREAAGGHQPPASLPARIASLAPTVTTVAISWHEGKKPQVLGGVPTVVLGDAMARDVSTSGVFVYAAPGGFAQAHRAQASAVYLHVAEQLAAALVGLRDRRVLEAFAGSGSIGLLLALRGARVRLVESIGPAARAAQRAADEQGLAVESVVGDATKVMNAWADAHDPVDAVVVNPPRRGLSPGLREAAIRLAPRAIAYVSCEPETLARDLDHFARAGYRCDLAAPFDLMPQTHEVETVVVVTRRPAIGPVILERRAGVMFVAKPGLERGEGLLARAGASALLDAPDADASGVALLLTDGSQRSAWTDALKTAERTCLALVRGIVHAKGTLRGSTRATYRRIDVLAGHSLVRWNGLSSDSTAMRRQFAAIGHPVLGDERFGHAPSNRHYGERYGLERPFVHLESIEMVDPARAERFIVRAPLAGDLASVLARSAGKGAQE